MHIRPNYPGKAKDGRLSGFSPAARLYECHEDRVTGDDSGGERSRKRDRAWTAFWADPGQSRCAAGAPAIWQVLANHWAAFARSLPQGTAVLDLGCGAGVVARLLVGARPDLRVTGVDSAKIPPAALPQISVLSHTAMESLPFPERRFGAVASQFGYEYSQTDATTHELARVLAPGAQLSFLVHHADSAIVASTRARLGVIHALLGQAMRTAFCSGDAASFNARMRMLMEKHAGEPLIAQLAQALPPCLRNAPEKRISTWVAIEEALAPERCVAETLEECCVGAARLDEWLEPLRSICQLPPVSVLREPNGDPIAWKVEGRRAI